MKPLRIVFVAAVIACVTSESTVLAESTEKKLFIYQTRVDQLYRILMEQCQEHSKVGRRHLIDHQTLSTKLEVEKVTYTRLLDQLVECRKAKASTSTTVMITVIPTTLPATPSTITTTETKSTAKTTNSTTTAVEPLPQECSTATSYTEPWRMDYNGSHIRPLEPHVNGGYSCDADRRTTQWFRFSGAAGNRMLNRCPKFKSCGTGMPLWTDEDMPTAVGVNTKVKVYGVIQTRCKERTFSVEVMRCSWVTNHDLIYKSLKYDWLCFYGFCGMM